MKDSDTVHDVNLIFCGGGTFERTGYFRRLKNSMHRSLSLDRLNKYAEEDTHSPVSPESASRRFYTPRDYTRIDHPIFRAIEIFSDEISQGACVFNSRAQREWIVKKYSLLIQNFPELNQTEIERVLKLLAGLIGIDDTEKYERNGIFRIRIDNNYFTVYIDNMLVPKLKTLILRYIDEPEFIRFCIQHSKDTQFSQRVIDFLNNKSAEWG
jgi:hypothetical protein